MANESTYRIQGMTCAACVSSVDSIISQINNVEHVRVNLALEKAVVRWNEGTQHDHISVEEAVNRGGFVATSMPTAQEIREQQVLAVQQQGTNATIALA